MKNRYKQRQFDCDLQEINILSQKFDFDDKNDFLLKKFGVNFENADSFFTDGEVGL